MSKAPVRGKLRNPPRGRQYAMMAVVVVLLVAGGSGAYLYLSSNPGTTLTTTGSTSSSTTGSTSGFANTPCTPSSTSATTSGSSTEYALICTNLGLIEVELYPQYAPQTVANFVSLANQRFYNDLVWHRIVSGFVIQAGDPNTKNGGGDRTSWGTGTSGTNVPFEGPPSNPLSNVAGSVAMASTAAGSGGSSQFYINLVDNSGSLDGKYAVFGQVISGMSVVNALAKVSVNSSDQPVDASAAYIVSVTIQSTP